MSLENTARSMMKRNEVLAQLLALSPTKSHHGLDLATPRRKTARPMSLIIPRVPSSPGQQVSRSRPPSVITSPAGPTSAYPPAHHSSSPVAFGLSGLGIESARGSYGGQSIDSGLGESCSQITDGSRRSTLASYSSNSPEILPVAHPLHEGRPQPPWRQPIKRRPSQVPARIKSAQAIVIAHFRSRAW